MTKSIMRKLFPGQHISRHTGLPTGHRHHHRHHGHCHSRKVKVIITPEVSPIHTTTYVPVPVPQPAVPAVVEKPAVVQTHTVVYHDPKESGGKKAARWLGVLAVIAGVALFVLGIVNANPVMIGVGFALGNVGMIAVNLSVRDKPQTTTCTKTTI